MDSHTISALNRLEVVETGRRRRWSEEEKARTVLESMSEPRLVAPTAADIVGFGSPNNGPLRGAEICSLANRSVSSADILVLWSGHG
jgi:hypothetical protein